MFTEQQISQLVQDARAANFNTLIVEVRRRGDAFYNSKFEPKVVGVAADFDPLQTLITKAHDTNIGPRIQVHCWLVTYPMSEGKNTYPPRQPDHPLNLHPDWINYTANGAMTDGYSYYFDPGHPEVQKHTFNVAMDLVTRYDIDGINWDYIRYPGNRWGYNPATVARFNSRFGRTGQPPADDPDWLQFRRDQVSALLRKVYLSTVAIKPQLIHSVDTFAVLPSGDEESSWLQSSAYSHVLQDWKAWMEEGIVDLNVPMTYLDHDTRAKQYAFSSAFTKNHRYSRFALIGPATYDNSISNSIVQIRNTREATAEGNRADGVACYSYAAISKNRDPRSELIKALTKTTPHDPIVPPVFAEPAVSPSMPWKAAPTKGYLKGFIVYDSTTAVDGASVTLDGPAKKTMMSDATGFYGAVDLPPGRYTVQASFPGCEPSIKIISISAGKVTDADLSLAPSGLAIALQPQDKAALTGTDATLSVRTVGRRPISFQWLWNDSPVAHATNQDLVISNFQPRDTGDYRVIVSNATGSITSAVAKLNCEFRIATNVIGNGTIALSPKRASYASGSSVIVVPHPELGYQFSHWSGDVSSSNALLKLVLTNHVAITANFTKSSNDLVVDNNYAVFSGSWVLGTTASDRYGADYRYTATTTGEPTGTATYRPTITAAGDYDVFIWYPQGQNRSTNAEVVVHHSGGAITSVVNQVSGGGDWRLVASAKHFGAGTNGFLQFSNNTGEQDRYIMADAVRFVWSKKQVPSTIDETKAAAHRKNAFLLSDFETNRVGSSVLFHATTAEFVDDKTPPTTRVTNQLPQGNPSSNALLLKCSFLAATNRNIPWVRFTTHDSAVLPNPTVSIDATIAFAVYAEKSVYIALGLRETDSTADIGANGKNHGMIEWIGGVTDNTSKPPKGHFVPSGQWVRMEFCIPAEPIAGFTGDGTLDSKTGKVVFEELAIVPADGPGAYNLYIDDVSFIPFAQ